jgi:hypothetical protein
LLNNLISTLLKILLLIISFHTIKTYLFISSDGSSAKLPQHKAEAVDICLEESLEGVLVQAAVQNFRRHVPTSPHPRVVIADVYRFRFAEKKPTF